MMVIKWENLKARDDAHIVCKFTKLLIAKLIEKAPKTAENTTKKQVDYN